MPKELSQEASASRALTADEPIVIVGGGLAGARTSQLLRTKGFEGRIVLVSAEPHRPYDRPPLSKQVLLGKRDDSTLEIDLEALQVEWLHAEATGLNLEARTVRVQPAGGTASKDLSYSRLAIATGASPIRLPGLGEQITLRTIEDALTLRTKLVDGAAAVIIGASWIGAEVATAALANNCNVTCLELSNAPVANALGDQVGKRLIEWWAGVDLQVGTGVVEVREDGVVLADGSILHADVVVTGIGVRPDMTWLQGSGLSLDGGVLVDEWLRAAPDVVAVGDVAVWRSNRYGRHMKLEHWDNAATGPQVAATSLLRDWTEESDGASEMHDPIPYFWSDQFGHKLQYVGHHDLADVPVWRTPGDGKGWSVAWLSADGRHLVSAGTDGTVGAPSLLGTFPTPIAYRTRASPSMTPDIDAAVGRSGTTSVTHVKRNRDRR